MKPRFRVTQLTVGPQFHATTAHKRRICGSPVARDYSTPRWHVPASYGFSPSLVFLITNRQPRCFRPTAWASIPHATGWQHFLVLICLHAQANRPLADLWETGSEWIRTDHSACFLSPPWSTAQGEMGDSKAWILPPAPRWASVVPAKEPREVFKVGSDFLCHWGWGNGEKVKRKTRG